ncbi:MAG: hypothetical protein E7Z73_11025 [Methanobrevibacter millerae]|uniref:Dolichyl-phosphate-mannose-protein mannosyltransferase n=1 Tax=Methanobrevibacter millerae TaxID=230361 RepID=A0A8T3VNJ4_9EURY|nr:glycosyltransferase family 39 protein [Methanobrevibacter millerae]MBE6506240.1 hypothetical protein [Methanobrevibacter millerae]
MEFNKEHKDIIGTAFFALSIAMLGYMLVSPLNQMIIHVDEYFTLSVLHFPITALPQVISYDVHPPFHYMLLKVVTDILTALGLQANKIFAYKIMSIVPYAIILVLSFTKIRKEYGYLTAGLFAFSMAVMSEFLPYYSVIRMYSWAMLFLILAFVFLRDVIDKNDTKSWALLTIFSVLAAYSHYFAAIPVACIYVAFLFYFLRDKEKIKYWLISAVCGIILYVPWIFALTNQLAFVGGGYWIPEISAKNIIGFFGYFVTSSRNLYTCMFAIAILAVLIFYSARRFRDIDETDRFYIISGIIAYFGTIVIGTAVSIIFKPILVDRYLLPSAAILWFVISIWAGKVEAKKEFLITFGLILLLLAAGISQLGSCNDFWLTNNWNKEAFFDQVANDNSSIVINHPSNRMFYMEYGNTTEMYLLNPPDKLYGYKLSELHNLFDFKEISKEDIPKLVQNNTDKNIYIISAKPTFDKNLTTQPIIKTNTVSFLEVK